MRRRGAIDAQPAGALSGNAVALKDNLVTTDHPTTCASRILEGYVSPFEATAVAPPAQGGAMVAGKANLDEFAMGSSTEHSAFGRVLTPARSVARAGRIERAGLLPWSRRA